MTRRASAIIALVVGLSLGAACPFIQVAFECRERASEACVWGKALLPVSVAVSTVFIGAIAAFAIFLALERRGQANEKRDSD